MKLNAVGKPYSASYDPNYKLRGARTSIAHLYFPYSRMKFVGEELREHHRQQPKTKTKTKSEKSATALLDWKENARKAEFTARAPLSIGGCYVLTPFFGCWSVDHRGKRNRGRRQVGFTYSFDEAKALAQADSAQSNGCQIRSASCL